MYVELAGIELAWFIFLCPSFFNFKTILAIKRFWKLCCVQGFHLSLYHNIMTHSCWIITTPLKNKSKIPCLVISGKLLLMVPGGFITMSSTPLFFNLLLCNSLWRYRLPKGYFPINVSLPINVSPCLVGVDAGWVNQPISQKHFRPPKGFQGSYCEYIRPRRFSYDSETKSFPHHRSWF